MRPREEQLPFDPGAGDWTLLYADACAVPALATVVAALRRPAGRSPRQDVTRYA
ncbi:hypothetical protein OG357_37375 [Streptomyces sp. NBC_01255]|uniref:hypothetical protein n=1 Tax=Streptomyces sp. NBC_01255 TaxID=2903798 RepID=UPI002E2F7F5D|nr:hypothetical protein [Streptomyces sp. NBC_01255]